MEKYRSRLKRRQRYLIIAFVAALVLGIGLIYYTMNMRGGTSRENSFFTGFVTGFPAAIIAVFFAYIIQIQRVLKNDDKLREMHRREEDERSKDILVKSAAGTLSILMMILPLAAIVAGFFNWAIFITLIAVVGVVAIIRLLLNRYYTKKY